MEKRIRYGVELFERKCKVCLRCFWVPLDSPQLYCNIECKVDDGAEVKKWVLDRIRGGV